MFSGILHCIFAASTPPQDKTLPDLPMLHDSHECDLFIINYHQTRIKILSSLYHALPLDHTKHRDVWNVFESQLQIDALDLINHYREVPHCVDKDTLCKALGDATLLSARKASVKVEEEPRKNVFYKWIEALFD